jgi:hypothetical protein
MADLNRLQIRLDSLDARMSEAEADLAQLRRRSRPVPRTLWAMAALVGALVFLTVGAAPLAESPAKAPFEVVDENNKIILRIAEERSLAVFRPQDQQTPALIASAPAEGHAFFKVQAGQGQVAVLGVAAGKTPEMELRSGGVSKVLIAAEGGKPSLELLNGKTPLLQLGQGERGAGRLQIEDASGKIMVQAGTTPNGVGAVSTYTQAPPGGQFVRVPNSFICGVGCAR